MADLQPDVQERGVRRQCREDRARSSHDGPTHLQAYVKETFHEGWRRSLEECTEYECQNILNSLDHPYAAERLGEFKRGNRNNPLMIDLM